MKTRWMKMIVVLAMLVVGKSVFAEEAKEKVSTRLEEHSISCEHNEKIQKLEKELEQALSHIAEQLKKAEAKKKDDGDDESDDEEDKEDAKKTALNKEKRKYLDVAVWVEAEEMLTDEYGDEVFAYDFYQTNKKEIRDSLNEKLDEVVKGYFYNLYAREQNLLTLPDIRGKKRSDENFFYKAEKQKKRLSVAIKQLSKEIQSKEGKISQDELHKLKLKQYTLKKFKTKFNEVLENPEEFSPEFAPGADGDIDAEMVLALTMANGGTLDPQLMQMFMNGGSQGFRPQRRQGINVGLGSTPMGGVQFDINGLTDQYGAGISGSFGNDYDKLYRHLPPGSSPWMFNQGMGGFNPAANPFADPASQWFN